MELCGTEEAAAAAEVERVRGGDGEESRSWRRDAAAGGERKSAKAAAEGRRRSGDEVSRREESSLDAPPMAPADGDGGAGSWEGFALPACLAVGDEQRSGRSGLVGRHGAADGGGGSTSSNISTRSHG